MVGKIKINCISKEGKKEVVIDHNKKEGYLIEPKTWCRIKFLTKNATLLVACNMEYEFKDYIEDYSSFLKILKKK